VKQPEAMFKRHILLCLVCCWVVASPLAVCLAGECCVGVTINGIFSGGACEQTYHDNPFIRWECSGGKINLQPIGSGTACGACSPRPTTLTIALLVIVPLALLVGCVVALVVCVRACNQRRPQYVIAQSESLPLLTDSGGKDHHPGQHGSINL